MNEYPRIAEIEVTAHWLRQMGVFCAAWSREVASEEEERAFRWQAMNGELSILHADRIERSVVGDPA